MALAARGFLDWERFQRPLQESWSVPGCFVVIDNSNVWIEGKKASARKHGLANPDDRWRINAQKLVSLILQSNYAARIVLFGSVPPPVDTVWEKFSRVLEVELSKRNKWTKREKEVDLKLGNTVAKDASALYALNTMGVNREIFASRTYIVVGGDRDYSEVVKDILSYGFSVQIWSWRSALNFSYLNLLRPGNPVISELCPNYYTRCSVWREAWGDRFSVHLLDPHIDTIGFIEDNFHFDKYRFPRHSTIVILNAEKNAAQIEELILNVCCTYISHRYRDETKFFWILDPRFDTHHVEMAMDIAKTLIDPADVITLLQLNPTQEQLSKVVEWTSFGLLAEEEKDEDSGEERDVADGTPPPEPEEGGWVPVTDTEANRRRITTFNRSAAVGTQWCVWREFCTRGAACTFRHSEEERRLFASNGGTSPLTERNFPIRHKHCNNPEHSSFQTFPFCRYLHRDQKEFCKNCLGFFPFDGKCSCGAARAERRVLQPGKGAKEHFNLRTGKCSAHGTLTCERCLFLASPASR